MKSNISLPLYEMQVISINSDVPIRKYFNQLKGNLKFQIDNFN